MTHNLKPKMSVTDDIYLSSNPQDKLQTLDPGTSYEVFRNNDTAIEVIVKDTSNKNMKNMPVNTFMMRAATIKKLQTDLEKLRDELEKSNDELESSKKGFKAVSAELKKQLDTANQREYETHSKNLALQLENEKLQALLESKTNLVDKLKKELLSMKRVLKFAIKGICTAPQIPEDTSSSDVDYEDFENSLKKECRVRFAEDTLDSSAIKSSCGNSYEKRY